MCLALSMHTGGSKNNHSTIKSSTKDHYLSPIYSCLFFITKAETLWQQEHLRASGRPGIRVGKKRVHNKSDREWKNDFKSRSSHPGWVVRVSPQYSKVVGSITSQGI